jgi:alpha-mannosidase
MPIDPAIAKIERWVEELAAQRVSATQPLGPLHVRQLLVGDETRETAFTLSEGQVWGEPDGLYLMQFEVTLPEDWREQMVALYLQVAQPVWQVSEGLLAVDGQPFHAVDQYHHEVILPAALAGRECFEVTLRNWLGYGEAPRMVQALKLRLLDAGADQLHRLAHFVLELAKQFPADSRTRLQLLAALERMSRTLDMRAGKRSPQFYGSCQAALHRLRQDYAALAVLDGAMQGMQPSQAGAIPQPHLTAFGHAHIDVAWLWRLRDTRMKIINTFSTQLYHLERFPQFRFFQSSPQIYQFLKEDAPALYEQVRARIAAGQWEAEGGTWLEMDTNITGGESLVRQFLYGKRFFREEFGVNSRMLFLPDVFGYAATLPQIIKGAGADYFITQKMSWNETNRFPYDTFWWESLDGTRVLTQYITNPGGSWFTDAVYTYNSNTGPGDVFGTWKAYQQKALNHELLLAFGHGDGGGGPTREMIERLPLLERSVSPDMPTVTPGKVIEYLDRLRERLAARPETPVWKGELYLEYHRGTYTSQAAIKKANRAAEQALHTAEWLAVLAEHFTGAAYPVNELETAWKLLLLNQFHDILPGSSIGPVYVDAAQDFAHIAAMTDAITSTALEQLTARMQAADGAVIAWNALGWARADLVMVPEGIAHACRLPMQPIGTGQALVLVEDVPALGYHAYLPEEDAGADSAESTGDFSITPTQIETPFYRISLNERGQMTSLVDKEGYAGAGREVLAAGERGNVLQLFEDRPLNFDAWDINDFYEQKMWELDDLVSAAVVEAGSLRAGLRLEWRCGAQTRVVQHVYVYRHTRRIDFVTEVDWHERQTLLKVAFPVAIHSTEATAEIQFGNVRRPTHYNTSWDRARFETCAHRWFDLSEGDYGVAVLNDCKYGYDVHGHTLRQTLLKGAISPDPNADVGLHRFTYSLFPHAGDWFAGGVQRVASELNFPLLARVKTAPATPPTQTDAPLLPAWWSLVAASAPHVVIETIKRAEASDALVVRLYECANRRGPFALHFPFALAAAWETNLIEEEATPATLGSDGQSILAEIRPYQMKTFLVQPAR